MNNKTNLLFILADQLRAASLPIYGDTNIETPNIDRLASQGTVFDNMISTCAVCTPYRSMLLTGRHPQTTGHIMNFMTTRHDEISIGDAFGRAGYKTGWVGKWHLHRGSFPTTNGRDFVPEGRDRLGFDYWRGYNFHMNYFDGWVNTQDWRGETWEGYETEGLNRYATEFMDAAGDDPFCLFLSPHQPHGTPGKHAPDEYYKRLPKEFTFPANVSKEAKQYAEPMWRDYLAMTLALDDMIGDLMTYLERTGKAENTLVVFTSDHGTQGGAHFDDSHWPERGRPWQKMMPHEESLNVPLVMRLPGVFEGGTRQDTLTAPVDFFPSLCGLLDVPVPSTIEGHDLSRSWLDEPNAFEQEAVLTMCFTASFDHLKDGQEWRGVRTKNHSYDKRRSGGEHLYDLAADPLEMNDLIGDPASSEIESDMKAKLESLMSNLGDEFPPCSDYAVWFDEQRRVVRNAQGPLGDPEAEPDWSQLPISGGNA